MTAKEETTPKELTEEEAQAAQQKQEQAVREAQEKAQTPTRSRKPKSAVADLTDVDLVDQETGHPKPLSFQTENLQATVTNASGRALVKVAVKGYIGEEPVVLLAEDIGEFAELVDGLEKAAVAQRKAKK